MKKFLSVLALLGLLGVGCPTPTKLPASVTIPTEKIEAKNGFGKLPGLAPYGSLGTTEAVSSRSAMAVPVPAPSSPMAFNVASADAAVTVSGVKGGSSESVRVDMNPSKPVNIQPVMQKSVNIKYSVDTMLPDWQSEAEVLRIRRPNPDVGIIRALADPAGLPSVLANQIKQIQSANLSWIDTEGFQWNFDPMYGNLNWWKQYDQRALAEMEAGRAPNQPPTVDKARVIDAADRFLNAHGLSALREQGGVMDETPWTSASGMPCLIKGSDAAINTPDSAPFIYPGPCGWYPSEVTVYYGNKIEGLSAVDAGGHVLHLSSVQVSLQDDSVRGGNVQMPQSLDRSSYALMSKNEALKRLNQGGRNPVYAWGGEGGDVDVKITKTEFVWMRFDSWANNKQESFYLPALAAEGTVDRKIKGQESEVYRTVVPLVSDEAFDLGDQGGGGVPVPMMIRATAPANP